MIISKIAIRILRAFGKGATTLPGKIALALKYNILNHLSNGVRIICVTGTNGKTTTCALIEQGLKNSGLSYFINKSGANMITGVTTAFIDNSNVFGKCKKDYAILECDENSFPLISRYIDANVVVVTNIFRDQLDRYGEIEHTFEKILEAIKNMPLSTVVLNADCPITYSISRCIDNDIKTFGINADTKINAVSDVNYCPFCSSTLSYRSKIYAQLGDYYCSSCGYSRIKPTYAVDDIVSVDDDGSSFLMNNKIVNISLGGIYNIYNFLSACTTLGIFGIYKVDKLTAFNGSFGRMEKFNYNGNSILMLLVKNPVGFSNCINYVNKLNNIGAMVFALNDNEADGTDVSWIWDVNFESLSYKTNNIVTAGIRAYDMALRLKYDNINVSKIIDGENYYELLDTIKSYESNVVVFTTYTSMMNMRHYFIDEFGGNEFWQ